MVPACPHQWRCVFSWCCVCVPCDAGFGYSRHWWQQSSSPSHRTQCGTLVVHWSTHGCTRRQNACCGISRMADVISRDGDCSVVWSVGRVVVRRCRSRRLLVHRNLIAHRSQFRGPNAWNIQKIFHLREYSFRCSIRNNCASCCWPNTCQSF